MISQLVNRHCQNIYRKPFLHLAVIIFLTAIAGYYYATLPVETSVESLIIDNDPELIFYEQFKKQFGEDEMLIAGFKYDKIFTPDFLRFIQEKTRELEKIPEAREVVSLTNVDDILGSDNDFIVKPLVETIPTDDTQLEAIRHRALDNPLICGNLIAASGKAALFAIRTRPHPDDETYDSRLIEKAKKILSDDNPFGVRFHFAGWLVTDVGMSSYMNRDMAVFMPLTYLLIAILLWFFLRNLSGMLISLATVTVTLVWAMALLNLVGGAMSPMTSTLPPLIMALAVSDCLHIFCKLFRHQAQTGITETLQNDLAELALPCFLTSLTTAVGFLSLGFSKIPPIRHFGLAAAGGMIAEYYLTMTVIPLAVHLLARNRKLSQVHHPRQAGSVTRLVNWWAKNFPRFRTRVLFLTCLALAISLFGMFRVEVETNLLKYFKPGSEIRRSTAFIDQHLGGANTIEVSFKSSEPDYFKEPGNLRFITRVSNFFIQQPNISKATSINDFLCQMNQAFHNEDRAFHKLPASRNLLAQYLLLYDGDELSYFINDSYNWLRLSFRTTEHSSKKLSARLAELENFIQKNRRDKNLDIRITGKTQLANKLINSIVESQVTSLASAYLVIFAILLFVFRSPKMGFLSMLPNTFPLVLNFGVMGLCHIPLNTATAIISAIALGIAVDDTIHYISAYQAKRHQGLPATRAASLAIADKGTAMVTTSLLLTGSFAILCFSNFVPTIQFGFLCSLIILSALIGDFIILPVILMRTKN